MHYYPDQNLVLPLSKLSITIMMNINTTTAILFASRFGKSVEDYCLQWETTLVEVYKLAWLKLLDLELDAKTVIGIICFTIVVFSQVISCIRGSKDKQASSLKNTDYARVSKETLERHNQDFVYDLAKTAYESGHTETVIRLVEKHGYDVNETIPSNGLSLFLCSCLSGKQELVNYMLQKGADVKLTTKDGDSPLYLATFGILNSSKYDISVIKELVKAGCSVNHQNYKGYTPLHRAASKGNTDVIKCLLKCGADPYLCSKSGIYPIDSAINSGYHEAAELLKIDIVNPHVWDLIDPHTPPRIQLGLQSPIRRHLLESSRPKNFSRVLRST